MRLHKLVFEEDVLPDGTEVAYYSRGKVVPTMMASQNLCIDLILSLLSGSVLFGRNFLLDIRRDMAYSVPAAARR